MNIAIQEDLAIVAEGIERVEELEYLDRYKEFILMQGFSILVFLIPFTVLFTFRTK